jgi:hypothetical protein
LGSGFGCRSLYADRDFATRLRDLVRCPAGIRTIEEPIGNPGLACEKLPRNHLLHTIVLVIVLVTAMVLFLRHQWG